MSESTAGTPSTPGRPELHPAFVENMVRTFNDSEAHGVHLLFNEWWEHAPEQTIAGYLEHLKRLPRASAFLEERYFAPQLELADLEARPEGSVGRGYFEFLSANGLETNLAANYRLLHEHMSASGHLDRMPEELRYAIVRGFQVHDILHVITGYTPDGLHELALQAFCLAQWQFPYFGMWMATTTSSMTFLRPEAIGPAMDAITQGWQFGRSVENLQIERWEDLFDEPLVDVRARYGIAANGMGSA